MEEAAATGTEPTSVENGASTLSTLESGTTRKVSELSSADSASHASSDDVTAEEQLMTQILRQSSNPSPNPPPALPAHSTATAAQAKAWVDSLYEPAQPSAPAPAAVPSLSSYSNSSASPISRNINAGSRKGSPKRRANKPNPVNLDGVIAAASVDATVDPALPANSTPYPRSHTTGGGRKVTISKTPTTRSRRGSISESRGSTRPSSPSKTSTLLLPNNSTSSPRPKTPAAGTVGIEYTPRLHAGKKHNSNKVATSSTNETFLTGVDADKDVSPTRSQKASRRSSLTGDGSAAAVLAQANAILGRGRSDGHTTDEEHDVGVSNSYNELQDFAEWLADDIPYKMQGDEAFYTPEALAARGALVKHPKILRWIDKFWKSLRGLDMKYGLKRDEFVLLQVKIAKVVDPTWSMAEAERTAVAEFQKEAGKTVGLTKEKFFRSMFELVDTWTSTINASDYIFFLQELFRRITVTKTRVTHTYTPEGGNVASKQEVYEYRDVKDVRPWKDVPFFYQELDKTRYVRLQQGSLALGPPLPESIPVSESEEEQDEETKAELEREKRRAEFRARKEAEAKEEAEREARGETDEPAQVRPVLTSPQPSLSPTAVKVFLGERDWLETQREGLLDPDELLGHISGEEDGSSGAGSAISTDESAGWPSEVESEKDEEQPPVDSRTDDEKFYGKKEGEYSVFVPSAPHVPQPVELHKPKPIIVVEAVIELSPEELKAKQEAERQQAKLAAIRRHNKSRSMSGNSVEFPEWMVDTSGSPKRETTASTDPNQQTSASSEATSPKAGGEGAEASTEDATAGTPKKHKRTASSLSGSSGSEFDDAPLGPNEMRSSITGRRREKFKIEAKALHEDAEANLNLTRQHLANWEQLQQKLNQKPGAPETMEQKKARLEAARAKKMAAKKQADREARLKAIQELHQKRAEKKAEAEARRLGDGGLVDDVPPSEEVEEQPTDAVQAEDNSEEAIIARLAAKRRGSRAMSMFAGQSKGRLAKHSTTHRASISVMQQLDGQASHQQSASLLSEPSNAPVAPLLTDGELKLKTLSVPVTSRRASKNLPASHPVKRPSIFQLLPDLRGPEGDPNDPLSLMQELPFGSDEEGENAQSGVGKRSSGNTRPSSGGNRNAGTEVEGWKSGDGVEGTSSGFSASAFFDATVNQPLSPSGAFIPAQERDRIRGRGSVSMLNPSAIGAAGRVFRRGLGNKITSPTAAAGGSAGKRKLKHRKKKRGAASGSDTDDDIFHGLSMGVEDDEGKKGRRKKKSSAHSTPSGSPRNAPAPFEPIPDLSLSNRVDVDEDGNPLLDLDQQLELKRAQSSLTSHTNHEDSVLDLTKGSVIIEEGDEDDEFQEIDRLAASIQAAEVERVRQEQAAKDAAAAAAAKATQAASTESLANMAAVDGSEEDKALLASLLAEADIHIPPSVQIDDDSTGTSAATSVAGSLNASPRVRPADWAPELEFMSAESLAHAASRRNDAEWQAAERKRIAKLLGLDSSSEESDDEDQVKKVKRRLRKKILPLIQFLPPKPRERKIIAFGRVVEVGNVKAKRSPRAAKLSAGIVFRPKQGSQTQNQLQKDLEALLGVGESDVDTIAAALEGEAEARELLHQMAQERARSRQVSVVDPSTGFNNDQSEAFDPDAMTVVEEQPLESLPSLPPSSTTSEAVSLSGTPAIVPSFTHTLPFLSDLSPSHESMHPSTPSFDFHFNSPQISMYRTAQQPELPTGYVFPQFVMQTPEAELDHIAGAEIPDQSKPKVEVVDNEDSRAPSAVSSRPSSAGSQKGPRYKNGRLVMPSDPQWSNKLESWSPRIRARLLKGGVTEPEIQMAAQVAFAMKLHDAKSESARQSRRGSRSASPGLGVTGLLPPTKDEDMASYVQNARQAWLISQMQQAALDEQIRKRLRERRKNEKLEARREEKRRDFELEVERQLEERARKMELVDDDVVFPEINTVYVPDSDSTVSSEDLDEAEMLEEMRERDSTAPGVGGDSVDDGIQAIIMPPELFALPPILPPHPRRAPPPKRDPASKVPVASLLAAANEEARRRKAELRAQRKKERDERLALLSPRSRRRSIRIGSPKDSADNSTEVSPTRRGGLSSATDESEHDSSATPVRERSPGPQSKEQSPNQQPRQITPAIAVFGVRPDTGAGVVSTEQRVPTRPSGEMADDPTMNSATAHARVRRGITFKNGRSNVVSRESNTPRDVRSFQDERPVVDEIQPSRSHSPKRSSVDTVVLADIEGNSMQNSPPSLSPQLSPTATFPVATEATLAAFRLNSTAAPIIQRRPRSRSPPQQRSQKPEQKEPFVLEKPNVPLVEHYSRPDKQTFQELLMPTTDFAAPIPHSSRLPPGYIRVAPSKSRLRARAEEEQQAREERAREEETQQVLALWEAEQKKLAEREARKKRLRARKQMTFAEAQADREAEEKERQEWLRENGGMGDEEKQEKASPTFPSRQYDHVHIDPVRQSLGAEPPRPPAVLPLVDNVFPFPPLMSLNRSPDSSDASTPRAQQQPQPPYFAASPSSSTPSQESRTPLQQQSRATSRGHHRPSTVGTTSVIAGVGAINPEEDPRVKAPLGGKLRIAKGTVISVRANTPLTRVVGTPALAQSHALETAEQEWRMPPPSRGTFSRAGASREASRGASDSGRNRLPSPSDSIENYRRQHSHSPPRGVPFAVSLLPLAMPPPPVASFNVPVTAKADVNHALKGTLVSPRFIAKKPSEMSQIKSQFAYPSGSMSARAPVHPATTYSVPVNDTGAHTMRVRVEAGVGQVVAALTSRPQKVATAVPPLHPKTAYSYQQQMHRSTDSTSF